MYFGGTDHTPGVGCGRAGPAREVLKAQVLEVHFEVLIGAHKAIWGYSGGKGGEGRRSP